jgi:putative colanic acid biosynthesis acetyltransferase WcaF
LEQCPCHNQDNGSKVTKKLKRQAKPGFRSKSGRLLWSVAWLFLFRPSPRPFHGWRRLILRLFGAKVGEKAMPYPGARIWAPWNLVMGDNSVLGDGVDCYSVDRITLEPGAVVSQRAFLCSASRDYDDERFPLLTAPIDIGCNAWVAAEAFIGPGVTLGSGAVVYARAVVTRDVDPKAIVAGNPAVNVGTRATTGRLKV